MSATATILADLTAFACPEEEQAQAQLDAALADLKKRHRTPRDARWIERDVAAEVADEPTAAERTLAYLDAIVPAYLAEVAEAAETIVEAIGSNPNTGDPYYTVQDVVGWVARAVSMGCALPRLSGQQIAKVWRGDSIPNARLREAYLEQKGEGEGLATQLAHAAGLIHGGKADTTHVERLLGVVSSGSGADLPSLSIFIDCQPAARFADALGLDYHDLGL